MGVGLMDKNGIRKWANTIAHFHDDEYLRDGKVDRDALEDLLYRHAMDLAMEIERDLCPAYTINVDYLGMPDEKVEELKEMIKEWSLEPMVLPSVVMKAEYTINCDRCLKPIDPLIEKFYRVPIMKGLPVGRVDTMCHGCYENEADDGDV